MLHRPHTAGGEQKGLTIMRAVMELSQSSANGRLSAFAERQNAFKSPVTPFPSSNQD